MTALLDDLGTWIDLGTVEPQLGTWNEFPIGATQGWTTFRVTYSIPFTPVRSRTYLRSFYVKGLTKVVSRDWIRLHPKSSQEIITIPYSPEFQFQQVIRGIEALKWFPFNRLSQSHIEPNYTISLEEFVPYPETVSAVTQVTLSESTLNAIALRVRDTISVLPPEIL